jgi:asparagine synthase (glutamine-hydrolysing)
LVGSSVSSGIANWNEQRLYATEYLHLHPFLALDGTVPFDLKELPGSRLNQHLDHLMFSTMLPSLLHYGDRIAMAYSIECRVPFLDHRLVEFVFSLDGDAKIRDGRNKYILRESMEDILPRNVPGRRDKQPFLGGEFVTWLRGPLRYLLDGDFNRLTMLDRKKTERLLEEHQNGDDSNAVLVWRLAVVNYWLGRQ